MVIAFPTGSFEALRAGLETAHDHLTTHEALSGIFGSISLASWIFLLVPQLIENYRQQSAEGISLLFLAVWFVGDVTSLAGALLANLVPTVIALSVYFCIADLILVVQCLYYNKLNASSNPLDKGPAASANADAAHTTVPKASDQTHISSFTTRSASTDATTTTSDDPEQQPLLSRRRSSDNLGLPGSHLRRCSSATGASASLLDRRRTSTSHRDSEHTAADAANDLTAILESGDGSRAWIKNTVSVLVICAAGAVGWFLAWRTRVWSPTPVSGDGDENTGQGSVDDTLGAQMLGYISALCYLGARIPQIIKNQRDRSCEGLSLLFFLLSLLGNATFGAGILFHSLNKTYILTNLPWLIGSLGTMFEDATIFVQFRVFRKRTAGGGGDGGGGDGSGLKADDLHNDNHDHDNNDDDGVAVE